jgi:hypothetical protein
MRQNKYEYDAFISHAVEDKIPIANELCAKLEMAGLKIWYSGKELGVGDSIEKTIERGLNRSRYGIVIFSPTYLAKNWTIREFYTLLAKEIEEQKVILPVLYNITLDELKNKDLVMADRFAVNSDKGIDFVVERLVREIKKTKVVKKKEAWFSRIWLILVFSLLANVTLLLKGTVFSSPGYSVLPSLADERPELQSYPTSHATLWGEMEGLLRTYSGCNCTNPHQASQSPPFQTAVQSQIVPLGNASGGLDQDGQSRGKMVGGQASKITVAVVFQMETAGQASPTMEREVDDVLQTISLNEEPEPFMAVTNRNFSSEHKGHDCVHDGYTGN